MRLRVRAVALALVLPLGASVVGLTGTPVKAAPVGGTIAAPRRAVLTFSSSQDKTTSLAVPAAATNVGPGSKLLITDSQQPGMEFGCTANFVWKDSTGALYLGAAGHCFLDQTSSPDAAIGSGPGGTYDTSTVSVKVCVSGCDFGGQTGFIITGTTKDLGKVAYAREAENGVEPGNDFGLVVIPAGLTVRHSLPVWGGPTTAAPNDTTGSLLCLYGNAEGLGETFLTMARTGVETIGDRNQWDAAIPSGPGDSGSAVETCQPSTNGLAGVAPVGILTSLTALGITGTTVTRAIEMVKNDQGRTIALQAP